MSQARDLIRTNVAPQSALMYTKDFARGSHFVNRAWTTTCNYSTQKIDIGPMNPTSNAIGTTANFRLVKNSDFYGYTCLQIPFTAVTKGTGATFARLTDFAGHHVINKISISHTSNRVQEIDGLFLNLQWRKNSTYTRDQVAKKRVLGGLTVSERETMSKFAQVAWVDFDNMVWFCYSTNNFVPVLTLSHELNFDVTFNNASHIIESDIPVGGTSPSVGITTATIKGQSYPLAFVNQMAHVTGLEREFHVGLYEGKGLAINHVVFKQQPRITIPAGTSGTVALRLTSIKDPISEFYWVIRLSRDVNTDYGKRLNKYLSYVGISFTGNSGEMVPFHSKEYIDTRLREQYHGSIPAENENLGFFSFAWIPEDHTNESGGVHFGNLSDPTVNLFIGTAPGHSELYDALHGVGEFGGVAQDATIELCFNVKNFIHQVGGDIRLVFA